MIIVRIKVDLWTEHRVLTTHWDGNENDCFLASDVKNSEISNDLYCIGAFILD